MELYSKEELPWLGHLLRPDEKSRKACWTDIFKSDFQYLNINDNIKLLQHLNVLGGDSKLWKTLTQALVVEYNSHVEEELFEITHLELMLFLRRN